jgi:hypothetical protein
MPKNNLPRLIDLNKNFLMLVVFVCTVLLAVFFIFNQKSGVSNNSLILNTNKSIYSPNEKVFLSIVYLDPTGKPTCDANLKITVNGPGIRNQEISKIGDSPAVTSFCKEAGAPSNEPDYVASFTPSQKGTYTIKLTASGEKLVTKKQIKVDDNQTLVVERQSPTKLILNQPFRYHTSLKISSPNKDFKGRLVEKVPSGLDIVWQGKALTQTNSQDKTLTWEVELKAGEIKEFLYEFKAPATKDLPINNLGKAYITVNGKKVFEELNFWQMVLTTK